MGTENTELSPDMTEKIRDQIRKEEESKVRSRIEDLTDKVRKLEKAATETPAPKAVTPVAVLEARTEDPAAALAPVLNKLNGFFEQVERSVSDLRSRVDEQAETTKRALEEQDQRNEQRRVEKAVSDRRKQLETEYGDKLMPEMLPGSFASVEDVEAAFKKSNEAWKKYVEPTLAKPAPQSPAATPLMPAGTFGLKGPDLGDGKEATLTDFRREVRSLTPEKYAEARDNIRKKVEAFIGEPVRTM